MLPLVEGDVEVILEDGLRDQDLAELEALGRNPEVSLREAVAASGLLVFTIHVDGRPAGIFGAMPTDVPDLGIAWMLGTPRLLLIRRDLVTEGRRWVEFLNNVYPALTNYIDERNSVSWSWLERMGFEFPYTDDFVTPEGISFRRFEKCVIPLR